MKLSYKYAWKMGHLWCADLYLTQNPRRFYPEAPQHKNISGTSPSGAPSRVEVAGLEVPSHGRQLDRQAVELLGHLDLAAEATRLGKTEGEVEHVVLVVVGLGDAVEVAVIGDDYMAGRAGAGATAGAWSCMVISDGAGGEWGVVAGRE